MMETVAWGAWSDFEQRIIAATPDKIKADTYDGQGDISIHALVRLSDAEARITKLLQDYDAAYNRGLRDGNRQSVEQQQAIHAAEARAEAAEALLKEAGNCMGIVLKNAKRVDMHGNGALSDIVGPWYMDQMRAIHHKIGVKDE